MCYDINRTIKAETGRKSSRGKMATYHPMMASQNNHKEGRKKTMARERMITRTVTSVEYDVMTVDMGSKSVSMDKVSIPSGDTMTDKARDKTIKASLPEGHTFVQITCQTIKETLYGMSEADFIKYAKVLPPRSANQNQ